MSDRPLILLTNDDGINSPGLHAAAAAVADLGDLLIIAPTMQQSGAGRSYHIKADKTIHPTEIVLNGQHYPAYRATVSPAQATALGITELAKRPIDLCISGINFGENIGSGITISGTVGAAIEAASFFIPAIAVSFETLPEYHLNHSADIDFTVAAHFTRHFATQILSKGLPPRVDLLKIDIPASATPETPWQFASVSRQRYYQPLTSAQLDDTGFDYHININPETLEPGSDIYIFAVEKKIPVVPMTIDMTAPVAFPSLTEFFNGNSA